MLSENSQQLDINLHLIKKDCLDVLLNLYKKANAGHIGPSLSCLDILIYLFSSQYNSARGDQFILSKGHAAGGLYVVLSKFGLLSESLSTFYQDGTQLAAHPPCNRKIPAIPFGTGSLGHGLGLATGIAFAEKLKALLGESTEEKKIFCVISDGECNEGSTWEAALFAGHHQLKNLVVFVDANGLQGLGSTRDILDLEPFEAKWRAFNFATFVIPDGNDFQNIHESFLKASAQAEDRPICLIARTKKGSGVSFMENQFQWHYLPMSDEQFKIAINEVKGNHA